MSGFILLHPFLLTGLVAAALPIIIHLIGRQRAPKIFFAAFDFLAAVNRRLAMWERLRQIWLLILRTLAVVAVVVAVSRPMRPQALTATRAKSTVAIVIDTSASMAYRLRGKSLLHRAQEQARDYLSHLTSGDAATVVAAGAETRALLPAPTADTNAVRLAIDSLGTPAGTADMGAAIELASGQLNGKGMVAVFSDLARNSFAHLRPIRQIPSPEVEFIDAAERSRLTPLFNLSLEQVTIEAGGQSPLERRFVVTAHNWSAEPSHSREVVLKVGGEVTQRVFLDVPARQSAKKTLTYAFPRAGYFAVELALAESDGFDVDDRLFVIAEVSPAVRVLLVNGDPRTTPYEDEVFFLEHALSLQPAGEAAIEVSTVSILDLPHEDVRKLLANVDVVVLANVGELGDTAVHALEDLVARGKGLLVTLGDRVQFERANAVLGPLLPHALRDLHRAADTAAGTPALGIGEMDFSHPVLRGLGTAGEEALRASRTSSYFNLEAGSGVATRVVLRFDNGAPALIERRARSGGRVMMLTTSVDADLTDLPIRSVYPALMQRLVRYLGNTMGDRPTQGARVGDAVEMPWPPGAQALRLTRPDGTSVQVRAPFGEANRVPLNGLDRPGVYRVEAQTTAWVRQDVLDFAVNSSLAESDFAPVALDEVSQALTGTDAERSIAVSLATQGARDAFAARGLASQLLFALCVILVLEGLLASRG